MKSKWLALVLPSLFLASCSSQEASSPASEAKPSSSVSQVSSSEAKSEQSKENSSSASSSKTLTSEDSMEKKSAEESAKESEKQSASSASESVSSSSSEKDASSSEAPKEFSGITFPDKKIDYDGADHLSECLVEGILPTGAKVEYLWKNADGQTVTEAIEVGKYKGEATIGKEGYITKVLTATLEISEVKENDPILAVNSTIYYRNGLDNGYLYSYAPSEESKHKRVSTDKVASFFSHGSKNAYLTSTAFLSSVKELEGDTLLTLGKYDYVASDGTYLYYVTNSLSKEKSGIYKAIPSSEEEPTLLYQGKAKYLTYLSGKLYFADPNNDNKLSCIGVSSSSSKATVTYDEPIKSLVSNDGVLYFNVNHLTGDFLASYNPSTKKYLKLTSSQGKYLTFVGSELYFYNTDLLNTALNGKGVYKVSLSGGDAEKVFDTERELNSLAYSSSLKSLLYIDPADLHLHSYSLSSKQTSDLLSDFVAPEYSLLNTGGKNIVSGDYLYFLDIYQGKKLRRMNLKTKAYETLSTGKVVDYSIIGDELYFNQVSWGVNNDLYCASLSSGGEAKKISADDCRELTSDGAYIYYAKHNAAGAATSLVRASKDGSSPVEFYSKGVSNIRIKDGNVYFLDGEKLYYIALADIKADSKDLEPTLLGKNFKNVDHFEFRENAIFYDVSNGTTQALRRSSMSDLESYVDLASKQTNPIDFIIEGDTVYYYSEPKTLSTDKSGFYKVSVDAEKDGTATLIASYQVEETYYHGQALAYHDGKIYFQNYGFFSLSGDSHIYSLDIKTGVYDKLV